MAKIISIDNKHVIQIPDQCIIRHDGEFISFQLSEFNWLHHALHQCHDCKAFLNSFGQDTYQWLLEVQYEVFILELKIFGRGNDHFNNLSEFVISGEFYGTRLKFRYKEADQQMIENLRIKHEKVEEYERCSQLLKIREYIKKLK